MSPMPPLAPREQAVALLQRSFDDPASGFEHTDHTPPAPKSPVTTAAKAAEAVIQFRMIVPASQNSLASTKTVPLPADLEPNDAFDRICANLGIRTEQGKLGCRFNDDNKTDPAQELSVATLPAIFRRAVTLVSNKRRRKEVFITVVNLDPTATQSEVPKRKPAEPKSTEKTSGTTEEELRHSLRCSDCKTDNGKVRLCHVGEGGRHVEVTPENVGLWARLIANGRATKDVLPNALTFDKAAVDAARPQSIRSNRYSSSSAPPTIHNHIHVDSKRKRSDDPLSSLENTPTKPKQRRLVHHDSDIDPVPLSGLFASLDAKYPAMGLVSKYEIPLANEGIAYLDTAVRFDEEFYVMNVGMSRGMASTFCAQAGKEYQRVLRGQGKGKEDINPFQ